MSTVESNPAMTWDMRVNLLTKGDDFIEVANADRIGHGAQLISRGEFKSLLFTKKAIPMIILAGISLLASLGFIFIYGISSLTIALIVGLPFVAILLLLLPVLLAPFISISRRK